MARRQHNTKNEPVGPPLDFTVNFNMSYNINDGPYAYVIGKAGPMHQTNLNLLWSENPPYVEGLNAGSTFTVYFIESLTRKVEKIWDPEIGSYIYAASLTWVNIGGISYRAYTFMMPNHSHYINVDYLTGYTLSTFHNYGGTLSAAPQTMASDGTVFVPTGQSCAITMSPNSPTYVLQDYDIFNGVVSNVIIGPWTVPQTYTFLTIPNNLYTLTAAFGLAPTYFNITATSGNGGSINPSGNVAVIGGTNQSFTLTPNTGYEFDTLTIDGVPSTTPVGSYTFYTVNANHTIHVTWRIKVLTVTSSTGNNGSINPLGVTNVNYGGSQSYVMTPVNNNYVIDTLLVDGVSSSYMVNIDGTYSYNFTNVTTNRTIHVTWKIKQWVITATLNGSGSLNPIGTVNVNHGANQTFTFSAASGYTIVSVLIDGTNDPVAVASGTYTFTNVTANHTIVVNISSLQYTITLTANPVGSSTLYGAGTFNAGSSRTISATVGVAYNWQGWYENNSLVTSSTSYGPFTLNSNRTFEARSTAKVFTIQGGIAGNTGLPGNNGVIVYYTINGGATQSVTSGAITSGLYFIQNVPYGANVVIWGQTLTGRSSTVSTTPATNNVTSSLTGKDITYTLNNYSVVLYQNPSGSGTLTGAGSFPYLSSRSVNASPNSGKKFVDWRNGSATGTLLTTNPTYNFTMPANHVYYYANFADDLWVLTVTAGANGTTQYKIGTANAVTVPAGTTINVNVLNGSSVTITFNPVHTYYTPASTTIPLTKYKRQSFTSNGTSYPGAVTSGSFAFNINSQNYTIVTGFAVEECTVFYLSTPTSANMYFNIVGNAPIAEGNANANYKYMTFLPGHSTSLGLESHPTVSQIYPGQNPRYRIVSRNVDGTTTTFPNPTFVYNSISFNNMQVGHYVIITSQFMPMIIIREHGKTYSTASLQPVGGTIGPKTNWTKRGRKFTNAIWNTSLNNPVKRGDGAYMEYSYPVDYNSQPEFEITSNFLRGTYAHFYLSTYWGNISPSSSPSGLDYVYMTNTSGSWSSSAYPAKCTRTYNSTTSKYDVVDLPGYIRYNLDSAVSGVEMERGKFKINGNIQYDVLIEFWTSLNYSLHFIVKSSDTASRYTGQTYIMQAGTSSTTSGTFNMDKVGSNANTVRETYSTGTPSITWNQVVKNNIQAANNRFKGLMNWSSLRSQFKGINKAGSDEVFNFRTQPFTLVWASTTTGANSGANSGKRWSYVLNLENQNNSATAYLTGRGDKWWASSGGADAIRFSYSSGMDNPFTGTETNEPNWQTTANTLNISQRLQPLTHFQTLHEQLYIYAIAHDGNGNYYTIQTMYLGNEINGARWKVLSGITSSNIIDITSSTYNDYRLTFNGNYDYGMPRRDASPIMASRIHGFVLYRTMIGADELRRMYDNGKITFSQTVFNWRNQWYTSRTYTE